MAESTGELFEILIKGPSPFGFRLHGGDGNLLIVAKLRARGKSRGAGLNEGDVVLGINGVSCQTISHGTAMTLIETTKDLLRLHLYRGSTDQKSLSTAYGAIANQLRPVSPGLTSLLSSMITPSTGVESPFEAVPGPPSATSDRETERLTSYAKQEMTSYAKQEVTSSVEAFATQTTTTETRHSVGRVTVTMATRNEEEEDEGEVRGSGGGTVPPSESDGTSSAMFHVPKIKSQQPMRWAPKGTKTTTTTTTTTTTSELLFQANKSITIELDTDKENLAPNKQMELVEIAKFPVGGDQQQQQQQFKAAKQWIWQPTGLPEREPALPTDSEVPDPPQESQPQQKPIEESSLAQKRHTETEEEERTDSRGTPPEDLSPRLVHILTTEATDDDSTSHRKKKKIFADSSFYDEPQHKYPTIEEQIRLARQVALSLSTPVNTPTARGQQMFRKRKEKAEDDDFPPPPSPLPPSTASPLLRHGTQPFYNPAPWRAPQAATKVEATVVLEAEEKEEECYGDPEAFSRNRTVFETGADAQRQEPPWKKALSSSSTTSPQPYAGLTKDLKGATGGRGAKLFAQKRAKALKEEEQEEVGEWFGNEGEANGFGETGDQVTPPDREEASNEAVLCPWESKTVGQSRRTPWQTTLSAANDAMERGTDRERPDDVPSFIAEKIPSLSYRPVKFHVA